MKQLPPKALKKNGRGGAPEGTTNRAGLNPGTSADLTVATLFAHRLTNSLPSAPNSG